MTDNKKTQTQGWNDVIRKLGLGTTVRISRVHLFVNSSCVKCDVIKKQMVRVGVVIFCIDCCLSEFKTADPVVEEREKYREWLKVWGEKTDDD